MNLNGIFSNTSNSKLDKDLLVFLEDRFEKVNLRKPILLIQNYPAHKELPKTLTQMQMFSAKT